MSTPVAAATVKAWLSEPGELAFMDVREAGQFGEGHPFFAVPVPFSRFEQALPALAPNPAVRLVVCDAGDGVAEQAAAGAEALGYGRVYVLTGGIAAWRDAGFTLYAGVNLPSKTFGELIEQASHTPRLSPRAVAALRASGANVVIIDGRPFTEYRKMSIPGGICCPNGEMALRIRDLVPDPATTIVVNCAGRTRSIIGAETLRALGLPNPVYALENGTQGWFLAGLQLEHGADRRYPDAARSGADQAGPARAFAARHGARHVSAAEAHGWLQDMTRTTMLLDVRTAEEVAAHAVPGFVHAPGGQLIQATDQWVGVKGSRLVLLDAEGVRAPIVAGWLRRLGHEACWLEGGIAAAAARAWTRPVAMPAPMRTVTARDIAADAAAGRTDVIDLRSSTSYRAGHAANARWSIRPRLAGAIRDPAQPVVLIADEPGIAALAAITLDEAGVGGVSMLAGGHAAWVAAGLPVEASPTLPADADCIDYLFFVHDRHDGNAQAARRYLAWETGLLAQLDAQERGVFRIGPAGP